jgi:hypothetical protein
MSRERDFVNWLAGYLHGRTDLNSHEIHQIYKRISFANDFKGMQYQDIVNKYKPKEIS